ncbi:MAG: hypothetical protein ACLP9L_06595 [Thermoguttaceae bacterium]
MRVFAAAVLFLVANGQSALASIYFHDGGVHQVSGGVIDGGIQVSNGSIVDISGGIINGDVEVSNGFVDISGGKIDGSLEVGDASVFGAGPPQSLPTPEPTTIIIWSVLGGLGITIGWPRHNSAA